MGFIVSRLRVLAGVVAEALVERTMALHDQLHPPERTADEHAQMVNDMVRAIDQYLAARASFNRVLFSGFFGSDDELNAAAVAASELRLKAPPGTHDKDLPPFRQLWGKRQGAVDEARLHLKRVLAAVLARLA